MLNLLTNGNQPSLGVGNSIHNIIIRVRIHEFLFQNNISIVFFTRITKKKIINKRI